MKPSFKLAILPNGGRQPTTPAPLGLPGDFVKLSHVMAELETAHRVFDATEVLDNQRCELLVVEANVWWELQPSAVGRAHARALAQQAVQACDDWDAEASPHVVSLESWLLRNSVDL